MQGLPVADAKPCLTCDSRQNRDDREGDCKVGESAEASIELLCVSERCKLSLPTVNRRGPAADAWVGIGKFVLVAEQLCVGHGETLLCSATDCAVSTTLSFFKCEFQRTSIVYIALARDRALQRLGVQLAVSAATDSW